MSSLEILLNVLGLLVLLVLSGAYAGAEAVLFSLTPVALQRDVESSSPLRRLAVRLVRDAKRTLTALLFANTAVNILLYAMTVTLFAELSSHFGAWLSPVAGVLSVLLVVFVGEVLPKVLGATMADRLAPYAALLVRVTMAPLGPVLRVLDVLLVEPAIRLISGRPTVSDGASSEVSAAELKTLLEMSRHHGAINPLENMFLHEVINLGALHVRDVMVPRVDVITYDVAGSGAELLELMRQHRRKKIPVYQGSRDNIVGLIYAKVLLFNPDRPLRELLQPVQFVPEIITCEQLLQHFRQTRTQLAIAVDEYGGVAGLVTLEDVLEQIVGDIDGPDDLPPRPEIVPLSDGSYDVSGLLHAVYWASALHLPAAEEGVATLGGLVLSRLGRTAQIGDRVQLGNLVLEVAALKGRRIDRLRVWREAHAAAAGVA